MSNIEQLSSKLKQVLYSDIYQFEIDTQDMVLGFKKTLKKRTKSMSKAILLQSKLIKDCGQMISANVRITAVRFYKNGELKNELK